MRENPKKSLKLLKKHLFSWIFFLFIKKPNPAATINGKKSVNVKLNPNCNKVLHNGADTASAKKKQIFFNGIHILLNFNLIYIRQTTCC